MSNKTEKAIIAFIIILLFGFWSYQYFVNSKIVDNYHLMIFIFLLFALKSKKRWKK